MWRSSCEADYYAGVWAHHDNKLFGSLEPGDVEEAIDAAQKIGDDYLQKRAQGYAVPDSFTHGTSEQRMQGSELRHPHRALPAAVIAGVMMRWLMRFRLAASDLEVFFLIMPRFLTNFAPKLILIRHL